MNTIEPTDVLVYYDGVEVFAGRDPIGGRYVGMIIDTVGGFDRYLVTGVTPERLRQFRTSAVDLRTLLLEAPGGEWYITEANGDPGSPLVLERQHELLTASNFLPDAGFLLDESPIDDFALQQARERGNVVFEFRAEPPETAAGHRIRATTLGSLLLQIQTVVKYAYRNAVRDLSSQSRQSIDTTNGHVMDVVVPAAPGSFRVVLEAAKPPDMFGHGELVRGLERLDAVFESANDLDIAGELLQNHKGHLAGSYIKLLTFLTTHKTGLRYAWAYPGAPVTQYGGVSETVATKLVEILSDVTNLSTEEVVFMGEFVRVNRDAGDWGLVLGEGERVSGKVAEGGPSLNGLEVGKVYRFDCLEEIDVDAIGNEKRTYYLRDSQPL